MSLIERKIKINIKINNFLFEIKQVRTFKLIEMTTDKI